MPNATPKQSLLPLFIGALIICLACFLAHPAWAYADALPDEASGAPIVKNDSGENPDSVTGQDAGNNTGCEEGLENARQNAINGEGGSAESQNEGDRAVGEEASIENTVDSPAVDKSNGEGAIKETGEQGAKENQGNSQESLTKANATTAQTVTQTKEATAAAPTGKGTATASATVESADVKAKEAQAEPSTKSKSTAGASKKSATTDAAAKASSAKGNVTVASAKTAAMPAKTAAKAANAKGNVAVAPAKTTATPAKTAAKVKSTAAASVSSSTATKAASSSKSKKFVIVIDAGHGGYDSGAVGYVVEKDVNLTIAKYLRQELSKYANVEVYMTRADDTYVALSDRVDIAAKWNADVVISVHNNAGGGSGSEVIVPNSSSWCYSKCYTQGQKLGYNILAELNALGLSTHSGVYSKDTTNDSHYPDGSLSDYFTLVAGPRENKILGIIVEHAFVDDASDAEFLQGNSNLKRLAQADARGVVKTFNLKLGDITKVKYDTPLAAGTYAIGTSTNGNQVLDIAGGSKANGANVLLWQYHDASWQKWDVSYDKQGMYIFKNVGTKKVLDSEGGMANTGNNVLAWQAKSSDYYNQRWVLVKSGSGYVIKSALDTGFVIDCMGGSSANGTNVALWDTNGGSNQRFYFINANPKVAYGKTLADGVYTMGVSNKKTQLVEVEGCSKKNCANVALYQKNGGSNQQWSFKYNGNGYYKIVNVNSGLALDVEGASIAPGTNVLQYKSNGGKNQLWGVQKNSNGTYSVYSAINGMALDVCAASTANGANVETYFRNGGKNQRFYLQVSKPVSSGYSIMGTSSVTVDQMVKYYGTTKAPYPSSTYASKGAKTISQFAKIAYEEANAEGVKAEVLFAQAMHETGNLQFGGSVSPSQCNFGGIGATGGPVKGATFSNVRQGLRAQVQHLKAYASTAALKNDCVDPRFDLVTRGSAKTVEQLSGKWATDSGYGSSIVAIINKIKKQ